MLLKCTRLHVYTNTVLDNYILQTMTSEINCISNTNGTLRLALLSWYMCYVTLRQRAGGAGCAAGV